MERAVSHGGVASGLSSPPTSTPSTFTLSFLFTFQRHCLQALRRGYHISPHFNSLFLWFFRFLKYVKSDNYVNIRIKFLIFFWIYGLVGFFCDGYIIEKGLLLSFFFYHIIWYGRSYNFPKELWFVNDGSSYKKPEL